MPTERNNRQLSEISDSKCEEVARKYWPTIVNAQRDERLPHPREILEEALLELQRETRRETLLEAANCPVCGRSRLVADGYLVGPDGYVVFRCPSCNVIFTSDCPREKWLSTPLAAELERKAKELEASKMTQHVCSQYCTPEDCPVQKARCSEAPPSTGPSYDPTRECCEFTKDASGVEQHKPECRNREAATSEGASSMLPYVAATRETLLAELSTLRARLAEVEQIMAEADVVDMNDLRMRLKGCDVYADIAKAKEVEAIRETDRAMAAEARVELLEKALAQAKDEIKNLREDERDMARSRNADKFSREGY